MRKRLWPCLSIPFDDPFIGRDFFECHRASGVKLLRGDADFCAKSELSSVGKTCGGIPIDTSGINFVEEALGCLRVFRHDTLAVATAVAGNVLKGFV